MERSVIIGLIGYDCAGKTTIGKYLVEKHGFQYHSLSDALREEAEARGLDKKVQTLVNLGIELREKEGNDTLAKRTLKKLQSNTRYVIDSIRHPAEVEALLKKPRFVPVGVDAPIADRFDRFNKRAREGESISLEDFARRDSKSFYTEDAGQQIGLCMPYAKHIIVNLGTDRDKMEQQLYPKVDKLLDAVKKPTWDDYFFKIMDAAAERSNCDRGKSGAVLVVNGSVAATGYVGAPPGLPTCDEVGHLMEKRTNPDGSITEHCIRTAHCEANVIAQAAKEGKATKNGILYISMEPCRDCTKLLIPAGIKEIKVRKKYQAGGISTEWLDQSGIKITRLSDEVQLY